MQQHITRFKLFLRRARRAIRRRRLVFALCLAVCATLLLTVVSVTIYNVGGFYRYDLSRPGFEKERQEISKTPTDVTYDTTSPITKKALDSFLQDLDTHNKNVNEYNAFGSTGLSDEDLQITTGQAPAPQ